MIHWIHGPWVRLYYPIYSKPLLNRLQLIQMSDNSDQNWKMKSAVHSWVHTLRRHMAFRKADESLVCSDKTWQFLQNYIITFKNKYYFWVFYWWINVLSFFKWRLYRDILLFIFISTTHIIKFLIYLCSKLLFFFFF
jgi:hypothetical protein